MKGKLLVKAVRKAVVVCTVGLVLLFSASYASAVDIVANGSFEVPGVTLGSFGVFSDPTITPGLEWTGFPIGPNCFNIFGVPIFGRFGLEIQNQCCGSPHSGNQHVELDAFCPSGMFQDLQTTPDVMYVLSFAYSPRPGVDDSRIRVMWGGALVKDLDESGIGLTDTEWEIICLLVDATDTTTRLQFEDASVPEPVGGVGGFIDSVSVEPQGDTGCISSTAMVDSTATVADDAIVEPGAIIEAGAMISSGVQIGAEAVIQEDTVIGANTIVGESAVVGPRTSVNQQSIIMPEALIGSDSDVGKTVIIGSQATMESSVTVGADAQVGVEGETVETTVVRANVVMGKGAKIWKGVEIKSGVTIDAEAEVGFAEEPGAEGLLDETVATTVVGANSSLGALSRIWMGANIGPRVKVGKGATVLAGAKIGSGTTMGAGSLVGADCCVPADTTIRANDTNTYATGSASCSCPAAGL